MSDVLEYFYDFTCPYAYVASARVEGAARDLGVTLRPRPILLGGILRAKGLPPAPAQGMNASKVRHSGRDVSRLAALAGLELRYPAGHPFRTVDALRAMLVLEEDAVDTMGAIHALYQAYWTRGADLGDPEVLSALLDDLDHDGGAILARAATGDFRQRLRRETDEAMADGIFGVPTFRLGSRKVWGIDRLYTLPPDGASLGGPLGSELGANAPTAPATFFFDYASPFAAIAAARVESLLGSAVRFHPMLLGGVFRALDTPMVPLNSFHEDKKQWARADMFRQAREADFPFKWPSRFPMNTVLALRVTLQAGPDTEGGRRLVHALFHAYWAEDQDLADPDVVVRVANACGLDGVGLVEGAGQPLVKQALRARTDEAVAAGVFGAPSFLVEAPSGESGLFWGADRLDLAAAASRGARHLL